MRRILIVMCFVLIAALLAAAQDGKPQSPPSIGMGELQLFRPADIKWVDAPPSLPKGAKMALLEGDPAKDGPFVFRLKVPEGYRIPPHTHPKVERVTVISGTFHIGMGFEFDESRMQEMPAGSFGFWPAGMEHFAMAKGETQVQLHGIGPWSIRYLNPQDDPRNQKP